MNLLLKKIAENKNIKKPVIYGIKGTELLDEEKTFFQKSGPIGLFYLLATSKIKYKLKN